MQACNSVTNNEKDDKDEIVGLEGYLEHPGETEAPLDEFIAQCDVNVMIPDEARTAGLVT